MTEFIAIAPTGLLQEIKNQRMHLTLAHLLAPNTKAGETARLFFQQSSQQAYIILDNSAHEGYYFKYWELIALASEVGASEIVVPDKPSSWSETAELAMHFLSLVAGDTETAKQVAALRPAWMLVPHGNTLQEWFQCCDVLMSDYVFLQREEPELFAKPLTLGFGITDVKERWQPEELDEVMGILQSFQVKFGCNLHILGWNRGPGLWDYVPPLLRKYNVRSVDTAKPFSLALYGDEIPEELRGRPQNVFDRQFTDLEVDRARQNLVHFRQVVRDASEQRDLDLIRELADA